MKLAFLTMLLAMLAGCDGAALQQLQPGRSTAAEVHAALGDPTAVWPGSGDTEIWEFSRQPEGSTCYHATMGADGVLRALDQVFDEHAMAAVHPGMDQAEVRRWLCKPARTQRFELSGETVWSWRMGDEFPGEKRYFTVSFDAAGKVLRSGRDVEPAH